jgi:hypothetical protein
MTRTAIAEGGWAMGWRNGWAIALIAIVVVACGGGTNLATPKGSGAANATAVVTEEPTEATETLSPAFDFEPIKLSGRGDKVAKFKIVEGVPGIATIAYTGLHNFAVISLADDGSDNALLVNTIGSYKGTVLFDISDGEHSVAFKVESSGSWTITVKPVLDARKWGVTGSITGKGDDVLLLDPQPSGLTTAKIVYKGEHNFAVIAYAASGSDLLVNEIGSYSGEVQVPDATLLLEVQASGSWTVTAT